MPYPRYPTLAALLAATLLAFAGSAGATGLQVSPTSLSLGEARAADGIWFSNTGRDRLHAQVRVYAWSQTGGKDLLEPSRALAASPPMLQLEPGARQLVRVIRTGAAPAGQEAGFRLIVDELPLDAPAAAGEASPPSGGSLQFVLRYSIPVFVLPHGTPAPQPALHGRLLRQDATSVLELDNAGGLHAQIANVAFVDARGQREELVPGLLGYVLPGSTMQWPLAIPAAALHRGGRVLARVNGDAAEHVLASIEPSP